MNEFEMRIINCTLDLCLGIVGISYLVSVYWGLEIVWKGLVKLVGIQKDKFIRFKTRRI